MQPDSVISPVVAAMLLIAIVLIIILPRRTVIMPFLIAFFTIPIGEVLVVGGVHFTALRILDFDRAGATAHLFPARKISWRLQQH